MRSRLISNAGTQNAIAFVGVGSAIARYPRQLQRINCNQSALRELNHKFMLI